MEDSCPSGVPEVFAVAHVVYTWALKGIAHDGFVAHVFAIMVQIVC